MATLRRVTGMASSADIRTTLLSAVRAFGTGFLLLGGFSERLKGVFAMCPMSSAYSMTCLRYRKSFPIVFGWRPSLIIEDSIAWMVSAVTWETVGSPGMCRHTRLEESS